MAKRRKMSEARRLEALADLGAADPDMVYGEHIDIEDWDVVEYQRLLEKKLSGWNTFKRAGDSSPGRRQKFKKVPKEKEKGKENKYAELTPDGVYRISPKKLRDGVQQLHDQAPQLTWNDVCTRVAKDAGYRKADSVREKTRDLKWLDPGRRPRS